MLAVSTASYWGDAVVALCVDELLDEVIDALDDEPNSYVARRQLPNGKVNGGQPDNPNCKFDQGVS